MYANFKGKLVDIYSDTKAIIRRIHVTNDIVNVQISGTGINATIAITMKNGKTLLYKTNGQLIRK